MHVGKKRDLFCLNNKPTFETSFENTKRLFDRLHDSPENRELPFFSFNFLKYYTHDHVSLPKDMDKRFWTLLRSLELKGYLENTLLILFSDHGQRTTSYTYTSEFGRLERSMPFLSVRLPRNLWQTRLHRNLVANRHKLVTHFDVYKTLRHFAHLSSSTDSSSAECRRRFATSDAEVRSLRGISLFEDSLPTNRSCQDALVPNVFCVCDQKSEMAEEEFKADTGHSFAEVNERSIKAINEKTSAFRDECEPFTFIKLMSAHKRILTVQFFYEFKYLVQPDDAIFVVYYRYQFVDVKRLDIYLKIVRLSKYGRQSDCMTEKEYYGFCFCKSKQVKEILDHDKK